MSSSSDSAVADHSVAVVVGHLAREPELRSLPTGHSVLQLDVRVQLDEGPRETVPVAWFDPPALAVGAGDRVLAVGRVQQRFFRVGGATQSRTELVADRVVPLRQRARAVARLADVIDELVDLSTVLEASRSGPSRSPGRPR